MLQHLSIRSVTHVAGFWCSFWLGGFGVFGNKLQLS